MHTCAPSVTVPASFTSYIVHEPAPVGQPGGFPALYYAYWFMVVLLVGTLAFFIPHSFLTGVRELFHKKRASNNDAADAH
jgi:hypothetical protein